MGISTWANRALLMSLHSFLQEKRGRLYLGGCEKDLQVVDYGLCRKVCLLLT